jgi:hypothetical protein
MALTIINYIRILTNTDEEILLVWGHGDRRADSVVGACEPDPDSQNPAVVNGQQIFRSTKLPFRRWCLLFRDLDKVGYTVTVIGMKDGVISTGPESQQIDSTAVRLPRAGIVAHPHRQTSDLAGPSHIKPKPFFTFAISGGDVTAERDDFVAYGDTTTNIVSANIMFPDGGIYDALQIYSDLDIQFWSAQYDSLTESGTYKITVTDDVPVSKNLDVSVT